MAERPTAGELVTAVREFLERELSDASDGRVAYHVRVAINALGIVERELELQTNHSAAERARLSELLGADTDPGASMDELRGDLAAAIRRGDFDDRVDEVLRSLRATVAETLTVNNPKYRD